MATQYYPIFLDLSGRSCVVVGAGRIATPKIQGLLDAGATVRVIAPDVDAEVEEWSLDGRILLERRVYTHGDLEGAFLAIAGTNSVSVNKSVHDEAKERLCLINVVDTKPLCEFIMPALIRRGDLTIAIGTNGIAPTLASQLRQRIEQMLDGGYAAFLDQAKIWRRRVNRLGIDYATKKLLWRDLIAQANTGGIERSGSQRSIESIFKRHGTLTALKRSGIDPIPLHVVGIDHAHAPLSLLEKVAAQIGTGEELARRLSTILDSRGKALYRGILPLSTCQRIEIYFDSDNPYEAQRVIIETLSKGGRLAKNELAAYTYSHTRSRAVHHMFNVAAGLESIVMFENEVQGQVRDAMRRSASWGTISPVIRQTAERALAVGKSVRRNIGEVPRRSLAHSAVEFALARTAGKAGKRIVVLGEGPFAVVIERALAEHDIVGERLTLDRFLAGLDGSFSGADRDVVLFSCLRTTSPVLTKAQFATFAGKRALLLAIMDLGMPRNVATDVGDLSNVQVWDLDDLGAIPPDASLESIVKARTLVSEALARYSARVLQATPLRGEVCLVGAGPGSPDLLTLGGREAIAAATVILHDRLVAPEILHHASSNCRTIAVGKEGHGEQTQQIDINRLMATLACEGERVVRLKGGDPFVFGRGAEELEYLASRGVDCRVIPGVSSVGAVPASIGIPLTHRLLAHSYAVVSAHDCSDPLRPLKRIADLAKSTDTLVILMGLSRIGEIVDVLLKAGLPPQRWAAAIESGTTPDERSVCAPLRELRQRVAEACLKSPGLIIVGDVVGLSPGHLKSARSLVESVRLSRKTRAKLSRASVSIISPAARV